VAEKDADKDTIKENYNPLNDMVLTRHGFVKGKEKSFLQNLKDKPFVGIIGIPPKEVMIELVKKNAIILSLDMYKVDQLITEPTDNILPRAYCAQIKRIIANILSVTDYWTGDVIDSVLVGRNPISEIIIETSEIARCNEMGFVADFIADELNIKLTRVKNADIERKGDYICKSSIPLDEKFGKIAGYFYRDLEKAKPFKPEYVKPKCAFWGTPPWGDFSLANYFPDETHVYGWTRCVENMTPGDLKLELEFDIDIPTVFFAQSFCPKAGLASYLANKHPRGIFIDMDLGLTRSTVAKLTAFLQLNGVI
jgi:hypothetical protein